MPQGKGPLEGLKKFNSIQKASEIAAGTDQPIRDPDPPDPPKWPIDWKTGKSSGAYGSTKTFKANLPENFRKK